MTTAVSIDGVLVPAGEARVPVFDRGFLYGDSVYEVVRTYDLAPFELEAHLARLAASAERIFLPLPWSAQRLEQGDPAGPSGFPRRRRGRSGRCALEPG